MRFVQIKTKNKPKSVQVIYNQTLIYIGYGYILEHHVLKTRASKITDIVPREISFFQMRREFLNMRTIPKNLTVEIKHCKTPHGHRIVWLEVNDSMDRARCSRAYTFDPDANTWYYAENGKFVEVTQEPVFRDLLNAYKSLMSVEDLISDNLTVVEEGY